MTVAAWPPTSPPQCLYRLCFAIVGRMATRDSSGWWVVAVWGIGLPVGGGMVRRSPVTCARTDFVRNRAGIVRYAAVGAGCDRGDRMAACLPGAGRNRIAGPATAGGDVPAGRSGPHEARAR